jgi:putative oxidoreductase
MQTNLSLERTHTMFTALQTPFSLVGRLLLALLFLPAGISKIGGFAGTVGYIASKGLPLPQVGAGLAIAIEIGASIALILGWQTRWAALILAVFTLAATVFFHNFWAMPPEQAMMQQLMFYKNIAVIGGLLTLAAWGAGALSLDAKRGA